MIRKLWFDEKPSTMGYYWFKGAAPKSNATVVFVGRGGHYAYVMGDNAKHRVAEMEGKWSAPIPYPSLHHANKYEQGLKDLTLAVVDFLAVLDAVMSEHSSPERGSKVAKLSNALNWANDAAMNFALGMSFEAMNGLKRKRERMRIKARKVRANGA